MISVPSRRLPLSGNKWAIYFIAGIILSACSPKIRPTVKPPEKQPQAEVKPPPTVIVPPVISIAPRVPSISLLLPFGLDKLDLSTGAPKSGLSSADLAVDYYQGFKLALDSLSAKGYSFKLQVFDTKDDAAQVHGLAQNADIRGSDLIVGPVYPENIRSFAAPLQGINKPEVSPLSPSAPAEFKNPDLITMIPPLEYHASRAAQYIAAHLKPANVFVLRSGYSDENKYLLPFIHSLDTLGKNRIKVVSLTVIHGNLDVLLPQLSATAENIFIVTSTDQVFLAVTLGALDKLAQTYPVTLFGHPNWSKAPFLQADMLQRLKTKITIADKIDYKSAAVISFSKSYRKAFNTEPGEYAIKGFDEGYYFGSLLNAGTDVFKALAANGYTGLHNQFSFIKTNASGWVNTHVCVYQYSNFDLKKVE